MYLWWKQERVYEKFINRRRIMKPNRAKSINVVTKINKATNRWVLMTEKQNRLSFTFHFIQPVFVTNIKVHIHGLKIRHRNHSVFGLDRPSSDSCLPNTCKLVLHNFYCCTVHFDNIKILFTNKFTLLLNI
jgi:hypothetical protein